MSIQTFGSIFTICNNVMGQDFNIFGFHITLWQFILFDIVTFIVLHSIVKLFDGE